jgi:hypothetical protein
MESSPDGEGAVLGTVRATLTRVAGPDALQAAETGVRVFGDGTPRPREETSLPRGEAAGARALVLEG